MTQTNLLELAKQGDVKAIATLINRQLQPKGITAKLSLNDRCLNILLEAAQVPNQQTFVSLMRKGITNLGVTSIERVKVYGRKIGEEFPSWSQEFELLGQQPSLPNSIASQSLATNTQIQPKQSSLKERAKQGNVDAIITLLNTALQHKNITAKASLKNGCLSVMLESDQVPGEEASVSLINRELTNLKVESIKIVKVYGKRTGEDFPAWSQEYELGLQMLNSTLSTPKKYFDANNIEPKKSNINPSPVAVNEKSDSSAVPQLTISVNGTTINLSHITLEFQSKILGVIGSILLFIGVFTPIVSAPIIGEVNYLYNGKGDGVILIILSLVSLFFCLKDKYKWLWFTGVSSLAVLSLGFIFFQIRISEVKAQMERELAGNPFRGLADTVIQSVQLKWGWAILIVGAGLIIAAAAIQEKETIGKHGYIGYFAELFNFKKSKKAYIVAAILASFLIFSNLASEFSIQIEAHDQAIRAKQSEAKQYVSAINKMEQAFYLENEKFASSWEELELGLRQETKNYNYKIQTPEPGKAIVTATAKEGGLKSYIGAVFITEDKITEDKTTVAIICATNRASKRPPETPQLVGNELQCLSGSSKPD